MCRVLLVVDKWRNLACVHMLAATHTFLNVSTASQIQGTDFSNSAANAPKSYADRCKAVSGCMRRIDVKKCDFLVCLVNIPEYLFRCASSESYICAETDVKKTGTTVAVNLTFLTLGCYLFKFCTYCVLSYIAQPLEALSPQALDISPSRILVGKFPESGWNQCKG